MAEDEEKLDFDSSGQASGYVSLDQVRVLAMRTARETPREYGRRFRNFPMAFQVVEDEETEDHYVVTLSVRRRASSPAPRDKSSTSSRKKGLSRTGRCSAFPWQSEGGESP
jgi:hypothetical protein